jgi:hypothetical protein
MTEKPIPKWAATGSFEDLDPADGYDSPQDAVREDIPEQYMTILGVQIEGDYARVWMLTNDRPPFEGYEDFLVRKDSKWFIPHGSGGFSDDTPAELLGKAAELGYTDHY